MKKNYFTLMFSLIYILCQAQNYMQVLDPRNQWDRADAYIDNVDIVIEPKGSYANISLEFDLFADEDGLFYSLNPLEFVMDFSMDKDIVFNESLLWINDYVSVGEIYESVEGTAIYEGIVDRQQDPSILKKLSSTFYNFRVYPLDADSSRRVRLSYQQPLGFVDKEVSIELPFHILHLSAFPINHLTVIVFDNDNLMHYELDNSLFSTISTDGYKTVYALNSELPVNNYLISYMPTDVDKNYYMGTYTDNDDSYFQLIYFPEFEVMQEGSNYLFVIDFHQNNTNLSQESILESIKSSLTEHLSSADSFNICYTNFSTRFSFNTFVPASEANINLALNNILVNRLSNSSKLTALIPEALFYMSELDYNTNLTILSNNTEYYRESDLTPILTEWQDFIRTLDKISRINVIDYASRNRSSRYINGQSYSGNEYLFRAISESNNGTYTRANSNNNILSALEPILYNDDILINEYSLSLKPSSGFTYGNYQNIYNNLAINIRKPIHLIGKFVGDAPFDFQFDFRANNDVYSETINITSDNIEELDISAAKIWSGNYLLNNEFSNQFQTREKVLQVSEDDNLLCAKTVFLCLEPDSIGISSSNFGDEIITVSTQEVKLDDSELKIFPNPFVEQFTIDWDTNSFELNSSTTLSIYNSQGARINVGTVDFKRNENRAFVTITLPEDIAPGMYIIYLHNGEKFVTKKIMHVH